MNFRRQPLGGAADVLRRWASLFAVGSSFFSGAPRASLSRIQPSGRPSTSRPVRPVTRLDPLSARFMWFSSRYGGVTGGNTPGTLENGRCSGLAGRISPSCERGRGASTCRGWWWVTRAMRPFCLGRSHAHTHTCCQTWTGGEHCGCDRGRCCLTRMAASGSIGRGRFAEGHCSSRSPRGLKQASFLV